MSQKKYRSMSYLLGGVLTYSISSFYFGYTLGYFNAIEFKKIYQIFRINMNQKTAQGIFSGCIPFGAMFGAYFSGFVMNRLSRSQSFILTDLLAIFAGIMVTIQYTETLLLGRFIQGLTVGFISALVPVMIKQFSPNQLSGAFGALFPPSLGFGMFIAYLFPYILKNYQDPTNFWRIPFGISMILMAIQLVLILKCYRNETPKYLILKNDINDARELIKQIYKDEYIDEILNQQIKNNVKNVNNNICINNHGGDEQDGELDPQLNYNDVHSQEKIRSLNGNNKQQYPHDVPVAMILAFMMQVFFQLSGITVIVIYGSKLVEDVIPQWKYEMPLIVNGQKIFAGLFGTILLNRFGRRYLMLRGIVILLLSLVGLLTCFSLKMDKYSIIQPLIIIFLVIYISTFVMTLGPITWLYISQIVQPPTVALTTMTHWIFSWLIITLFPIYKDYLNIILILFIISLFCHEMMCYFLMIETKDKNQRQIRQEYFNKWLNIVNLVKKGKSFVGGNQ